MNEGWFDNTFFQVFDENDILRLTSLYNINKYFPELMVVAIKGWDNFILKDNVTKYYLVPTIPLDNKYLEIINFDSNKLKLEEDKRFNGKIKWYVTPLIFGGDPELDSNIIWVELEQHIELVNYWNDIYIKVKNEQK